MAGRIPKTDSVYTWLAVLPEVSENLIDEIRRMHDNDNDSTRTGSEAFCRRGC
jgi:hypothetical protein